MLIIQNQFTACNRVFYGYDYLVVLEMYAGKNCHCELVSESTQLRLRQMLKHVQHDS